MNLHLLCNGLGKIQIYHDHLYPYENCKTTWYQSPADQVLVVEQLGLWQSWLWCHSKFISVQFLELDLIITWHKLMLGKCWKTVAYAFTLIKIMPVKCQHARRLSKLTFCWILRLTGVSRHCGSVKIQICVNVISLEYFVNNAHSDLFWIYNIFMMQQKAIKFKSVAIL